MGLVSPEATVATPGACLFLSWDQVRSLEASIGLDIAQGSQGCQEIRPTELLAVSMNTHTRGLRWNAASTQRQSTANF